MKPLHPNTILMFSLLGTTQGSKTQSITLCVMGANAGRTVITHHLFRQLDRKGK